MNWQYINIKPLSVNSAWKGRRFKTDEYKSYEKTILYLLKNSGTQTTITKDMKLKIYFGFSFSNALSDIDNPVKMLLDILQKHYKFNDSQVYELRIKKNIVAKGKEGITFKIEKLI